MARPRPPPRSVAGLRPADPPGADPRLAGRPDADGRPPVGERPLRTLRRPGCRDRGGRAGAGSGCTRPGGAVPRLGPARRAHRRRRAGPPQGARGPGRGACRRRRDRAVPAARRRGTGRGGQPRPRGRRGRRRAGVGPRLARRGRQPAQARGRWAVRRPARPPPGTGPPAQCGRRRPWRRSPRGRHGGPAGRQLGHRARHRARGRLRRGGGLVWLRRAARARAPGRVRHLSGARRCSRRPGRRGRADQRAGRPRRRGAHRHRGRRPRPARGRRRRRGSGRRRRRPGPRAAAPRRGGTPRAVRRVRRRDAPGPSRRRRLDRLAHPRHPRLPLRGGARCGGPRSRHRTRRHRRPGRQAPHAGGDGLVPGPDVRLRRRWGWSPRPRAAPGDPYADTLGAAARPVAVPVPLGVLAASHDGGASAPAGTDPDPGGSP